MGNFSQTENLHKYLLSDLKWTQSIKMDDLSEYKQLIYKHLMPKNWMAT